MPTKISTAARQANAEWTCRQHWRIALRFKPDAVLTPGSASLHPGLLLMENRAAVPLQEDVLASATPILNGIGLKAGLQHAAARSFTSLIPPSSYPSDFSSPRR